MDARYNMMLALAAARHVREERWDALVAIQHYIADLVPVALDAGCDWDEIEKVLSRDGR